MNVDFRVLGPLEARLDGVPLDLGPPKQRSVLALLLLNADQAVPMTRIVDELWPGGGPSSAVANVTSYLSRIRRTLAAAGCVLERRGPGHVLRVRPDAIDLARFAGQAGRGEAAWTAGEVAGAARHWADALATWRGDAFEGLPAGPELDAARAEWGERRRTVLERLALARLRLGGHPGVVADLRRHVLAEPLRETGWLLLVAALWFAGNPAAALEAYEQARAILAEQLGVDPGARLRGMHHAVLAEDSDAAWALLDGGTGGTGGTAPAPGPRPPAQLPLDVHGFTGRAGPLARLDAILGDAASQPTAVVISAVSGAAGVGKTALALHWAHLRTDRFPDGQLYVNLRGFHPGGVALGADQALHGFLTALGLPAERVPAGVEARSALYRTLLADRRMLILLDNARDAEQVRPLLPGAPGCFVLITSRHGFGGLVAAEAARPVQLDLLTRDEARALLARRLGEARTAAEPTAVDAIAERCARLPLALAIAAARAAVRPHAPLAEVAADLGDSRGRLDALSTGDPGTDVRAVFSWSYRLLSPAAAGLFRLLGLQPGADISVPAAAGLAGLDPSRAVPLLAELTGAHLLDEPVPGRYTFHDLLQAYAADLAREAAREGEDPAPALTRLFDHYLHTAAAAVHALFPAERPHRPGTPAAAPASVRVFSGPAAARAWLDTERTNLVAMAEHGAANGRPGHTTALASVLYRYFDSGHSDDALPLHTRAYEAARDSGDRAAAAGALNDIGVVHRRLGHFRLAAEHHQRALAGFREIGDRTGEARALSQLGVAHWRLGRYPEAEQAHRASLELFRAIGDRLGEANQLNAFGIGSRQGGEHRLAIDYHLQALALFRALDDRLDQADTLNHLGTSYRGNGEHERAVECHRQAMTIFQDLGYRPGEAYALNNLGHALLRLGRPEEACAHHQHALTVYREISERSFEVEAINGLGAALLAIGDPDSARARFRAALALADGTGDRHEQATAHDGLAGTFLATGDVEEARHHWRQALGIYTGLGLPDAGVVRDKLQGLDRLDRLAPQH